MTFVKIAQVSVDSLWRFMRMSNSGRALHMPDPIEIVPYDPAWPALFHKIAYPMRQAFGRVALRIDHIGSTAVKGLDAKPIIDIQISVVSFEPITAFRIPLEQLGYIFRADNLELTKRYFRESPGLRRTHIHVRRAGSWAEQFALLFRDFMRSHADEAARYAALKRHLAHQYRDDRHGYTEAKQAFVWDIMAQADAWSQRVGWLPGSSDA
jgi:GrpB-like predicted nucleotidyltransferase (UPF0157 family)